MADYYYDAVNGLTYDYCGTMPVRESCFDDRHWQEGNTISCVDKRIDMKRIHPSVHCTDEQWHEYINWREHE